MKPITADPTAASPPVSASKLEAAMHRINNSRLIGVAFIDASGVIGDVDEAFLRTLGYSRDELPTRLRDLTPPEHHRLDEDAFEKLIAFGACTPFEKEFIRKDGTRVPVLFGAAHSDDEISCFVIDLSQNKQAQDKFTHLAYHDALTDLPNQVLFK